VNQENYLVDFKSKPLTMFLEMLYLGQISDRNPSIDVLFDLYHLFNQSNFKDLCQNVMHNLKNLIDEKNCSKMLDFYLSAHLEDKEFLSELQKCMQSSTPNELCSIYLTCCEKNPNMLTQVVEWITSKMNKDTSSGWLFALDEHGIDNQNLWETLGSTMNSDTFHLWNIFQSKISKQNDRFDMLAKEKESLLERLVQLEKRLDNMK
jgi:hypothetical protein